MSFPPQPPGTFEAALEDFFTRIDNGEQPDRAEYYRRYPKHTEQLARFFEDLDFVDGVVTREIHLRRGTIAQNGACSPKNGSAFPTPLPEVPGFTVFEEIGQGSQGLVYKAEQHGTRRTVALKLIREGMLASKGERRRFESEVSLASRLQHPNIAAVYECGEDKGRAFYAMQYIDGEPLDVYLSMRTLDIRQTLDLFLQVCDAVTYAHQRGVIHRDLKPSNIIVSSAGNAYVVDFGLAKLMSASDQDHDANVTQVGEFAGTLYYASPEQVKRLPTLVDVRTDVYALGVILYELLTDCYPYQVSDESKEGLSHHILTTEPTKPSAIRRDIDNDLETIVLHALDKDIERRYQSVAAFAEDIRRYTRGEAIEAKRDSSWYVLRKTLRRHRWPVAIASGILIALVTFTVMIFVFYRRAEFARATTRARMEIVRESQQFVLGKLDELSWLANRSSNGDQLSKDWLKKRNEPLMSKTEAVTQLRFVADLPDTVSHMAWPPAEFRCEEIASRLRSQQEALDKIETLSLEKPFPFPIHAEFSSDLIAQVVVKYTADLGVVGTLFAHQAACRWKKGRYDEAIRDLDATRAIGIALCDGRMSYHKATGIRSRLWGYAAALEMLRDVGAASPKRRLVEWVLRDPPLARFRHGLIVERLKLSQILEEATVANPDGKGRHIDLDLLSEVKSVVRELGLVTDENRARTRLIPAEEVLDLADLYFNEVANWEGLSETERTARTAPLYRSLRQHRAWLLVRPLLPDVRLGLAFRGRTEAVRTQLLVTAHVLRYYWHTGHWPEMLGDAIPTGTEIKLIDRETVQPLRLSIEHNIPIVHYDRNIDAPVYHPPPQGL